MRSGSPEARGPGRRGSWGGGRWWRRKSPPRPPPPRAADKRIAGLYIVSISLMFGLGGIYAALIRLNLLVPDGSLMSAETYNRAFTGHGVVMIFFFLIPSIPAPLGHFLIPLMIGAKDLAFPRINLLRWY